MTRFLSFALIVGTTVFGYALYKQQDVGYINLGLGTFKVETSLLVFGAIFIALLFGLLLSLRAVDYTHKLLADFTLRCKRLFEGKSKQALSNSLIEIAEGHYEKAEKRLINAIKKSEDVLPLYLAAARAAHEQSAYERRDEYLDLAHATAKDESATNKERIRIAIDLIKAGLLLEHGQPEQALAVLDPLEKLSPKHVRVLTLLSDAYRQLSRWEQLRELITSLRKHNALPEDTILSLEMATWQGLINNNATPDKATLLSDLWDEAPAHVKTSSELLELYVYILKNIGHEDVAAQTLQESLMNNWQNELVVLYSGLDAPVDDKRLAITEEWLKEHPQDAHLLLILGKMCMTLGLWGKARSYLEASFAICPLPDTCLKLATLLEDRLAEPEIAQDYYKKGLRMLADENDSTTIKDRPEQNGSEQNPGPILKIVSPH